MTWLSPAQWGKQNRVSREMVLKLIHSGELEAVDFRGPESSTPRFKISPEATAEFLKRRTTRSRPKAKLPHVEEIV